MSFIGIISDNKDYEFIKKELMKDRDYYKLQLINIKEKNIENIKNVKFETMIICNDLKEIATKEVYIEKILKNTKYLIINSDINIKKDNIYNNVQIITYGMNQKATVTASSIQEDSILICIQRNIKNIEGNIIEMQEFRMKSENITNKKTYSLLVLFILQQLYKRNI